MNFPDAIEVVEIMLQRARDCHKGSRAHVALGIVLDAAGRTQSLEEKYQWLCAHVDDIAIHRDAYGAELGCIIFGDTKDENRTYPTLDALVTTELFITDPSNPQPREP